MSFFLCINAYIYLQNELISFVFSVVEEKRQPLWRRDMPGLKHIRGILYEEYPMGQVEDTTVGNNDSFSQGKFIRFDINLRC